MGREIKRLEKMNENSFLEQRWEQYVCHIKYGMHYSIISLKNAGMKREILLENHFNKERGLEKVLISRIK